MMTHTIKKYRNMLFVLALFFSSAGMLFALEVPALAGIPLHDTARVLSSQEFGALKEKLLQIDARKNFQAGVLIVKKLDGTDIETYATEVFEKWKLGSAADDNGVLLVVAVSDHKMRIEVGYGLEGTLTDAACGLIIRNIIAPQFKNDNYFQGIMDALSAMENSIEGDGSTLENVSAIQNSSDDDGSLIFYIIVLIIFMLIRFIFGFRRGGVLGGFSSLFSSFGSGFFGGDSGFSGRGGRSGGGGASGSW